MASSRRSGRNLAARILFSADDEIREGSTNVNPYFVPHQPLPLEQNQVFSLLRVHHLDFRTTSCRRKPKARGSLAHEHFATNAPPSI